jgi:hypothetical protein
VEAPVKHPFEELEEAVSQDRARERNRRRSARRLIKLALYALALGPLALVSVHKIVGESGDREVVTIEDITRPRAQSGVSVGESAAEASWNTGGLSSGGAGNGVPSGCSLAATGKLSCNIIKSSYSGAGSVADGGANFICNNNPASSSPCMANFSNALELGGKYPTPSAATAADVYLGAMQNRDGGYLLIVLNNYGSPGGGPEFEAFKVGYNGSGTFAQNLTIGTNGSDGRITTTAGSLYLQGAGGPLIEWNQGAGDVAQFYSGGGGTEVLDVQSDGTLKCYSAKSCGSTTLSGGTKAITVRSGAFCVCTSATTNAVRCSVSSTTLTATGTGTDAFSYLCM